MAWQVEFMPTFLKELARLPAKVRRQIERWSFVTLPSVDNPFDLGRLEKLAGYYDYFRTASVSFASARVRFPRLTSSC